MRINISMSGNNARRIIGSRKLDRVNRPLERLFMLYDKILSPKTRDSITNV